MAKTIALPVEHDYKVVLEPVITEKTMALLQNENKVTVKVGDFCNKDEIKASFERLYQVKVTDVKIINVAPKAKSRGGRYKGHIAGYKKAIVAIAEGEAVDLFKE
ncbi:MAG: 50S ribosomal protein L23 [Bacilli bacterium]|nr:50S ribosomal protein L23 [Bacilli bacterium]